MEQKRTEPQKTGLRLPPERGHWAKQPGGSKERIFESTLVILTPKRLKVQQKISQRQGLARKIELKQLKQILHEKYRGKPTRLGRPESRRSTNSRTASSSIWTSEGKSGPDATHPHLPRNNHQVVGDQLAEKLIDMAFETLGPEVGREQPLEGKSWSIPRCYACGTLVEERGQEIEQLPVPGPS